RRPRGRRHRSGPQLRVRTGPRTRPVPRGHRERGEALGALRRRPGRRVRPQGARAVLDLRLPPADRRQHAHEVRRVRQRVGALRRAHRRPGRRLRRALGDGRPAPELAHSPGRHRRLRRRAGPRRSEPAAGGGALARMSSMFQSLAEPNYRRWFGGALVSNTGTWMQRTAQDWIVLTQLTDEDATALGICMALQLGPQLLLFPVAGTLADRFRRRWMLLLTQILQGSMGLILFTLTVTNAIQLWHVYLLALSLGVVATVDAPVRQAFVSELVGEKLLPNAVSL